MSRKLARVVSPLVAGVLGLLWFLANEGGQKIVPTQVGWAMQGDWGQHLLGWEMFRNAPWALPLGKLPNLAAPMGTFVGYTDANPWVAVLLKPFSAWLPAQFQYVGPFIALSFVLAGVFGALLVRQLTVRVPLQILGGTLFALAPVLLKREGHDTLCAQWLLVAVLWLYFRPSTEPREARRTLIGVLVIDVLAAGIHPTLATMVVAMSLAVVVRIGLSRAVRWPEVAGWGAAVLGVSAGTFALFGYFAVHDRGGGGFGHFSADLAALINPADTSNWLPGIPRGPGQYEGYGYLGLAVIVLCVIAIVGAVMAKRRAEPSATPRLWPMVLACVAMAVFSLSGQVTWAGREVLSLAWLYRPIEGFVEAFRSSGRFIWPLHYLLIALGLLGVIRGFGRWPRAVAVGLLAVAVVQLAELGHGWSPKFGDVPNWGQFRNPVWELARGHYQEIALYPEVLFNGDWRGCTSDFGYGDVMLGGEEAYRLGLAFNSMYVSRANWDAMMANCHAFNRTVADGQFAPDVIYLIAPQRLGELRRYADSLACGVVDRHFVCVRADNRDPFRDALQGPKRAERQP